MTLAEAFAYIEKFTNLEKIRARSMRPYRLDRMRILLSLFDEPHLSSNTVHIAGSKGKGSTGAYLASILTEAGYKTGLYTSPHVESYTERFTLAGKPIGDELIANTVETISRTLADLPSDTLPGNADPTTFELLTLTAFLAFRDAGCTWAVIETGIGGRLDATNLVQPAVTLITPIELEHTEILGTTIAQIASEKGGIIKQSIPVFCAAQKPEAEKVLRTIAAERNAPFYSINEYLSSADTEVDGSVTYAVLTWKDGRDERFGLRMHGRVQADNAALACIAADSILEHAGVSRAVRAEARRGGIESTRLPGRMEIIGTHSPIVLDAAHTPASVSRLADSFASMFAAPRILIFGSVLGKNHGAMAEALVPHFDHIIISTPGTFKQSDPAAIFDRFSQLHSSVVLKADPADAFSHAMALAGGNTPILVTGSFYMIGEIRKIAAAHAQGIGGTPR